MEKAARVLGVVDDYDILEEGGIYIYIIKQRLYV